MIRSVRSLSTSPPSPRQQRTEQRRLLAACSKQHNAASSCCCRSSRPVSFCWRPSQPLLRRSTKNTLGTTTKRADGERCQQQCPPSTLTAAAAAASAATVLSVRERDATADVAHHFCLLLSKEKERAATEGRGFCAGEWQVDLLLCPRHCLLHQGERECCNILPTSLTPFLARSRHDCDRPITPTVMFIHKLLIATSGSTV